MVWLTPYLGSALVLHWHAKSLPFEASDLGQASGGSACPGVHAHKHPHSYAAQYRPEQLRESNGVPRVLPTPP